MRMCGATTLHESFWLSLGGQELLLQIVIEMRKKQVQRGGRNILFNRKIGDFFGGGRRKRDASEEYLLLCDAEVAMDVWRVVNFLSRFITLFC